VGEIISESVGGIIPERRAASPGIGTKPVRTSVWQSWLLVVGLLAFATASAAAPIQPGQIEVVDGDTIRFGTQVYRLVGFDTPETGLQSRCERERTLAAAATRRLRQLVAGGGLSLERVPCACQPGTEGTQRCNYGRLCGVLTARGRDVGATLIAEGLARRYECGARSCPRRESWCN
jgi:endonuclease YncB( thermonuclease family)